MILSVTGTRHGATREQLYALGMLLRVLYGKGARELHQGCCFGIDLQAALVARELFMQVVGHPGSTPAWTSPAALAACHEVSPARINKERNADLVKAAAEGWLVGCPQGAESQPTQRRSGTWQTVRMARARNCALALLMPDGTLRVKLPHG